MASPVRKFARQPSCSHRTVDQIGRVKTPKKRVSSRVAVRTFALYTPRFASPASAPGIRRHTALPVRFPVRGRRLMILADEDTARGDRDAHAFSWIVDIADGKHPVSFGSLNVDSGVRAGGPPLPAKSAIPHSRRSWISYPRGTRNQDLFWGRELISVKSGPQPSKTMTRPS